MIIDYTKLALGHIKRKKTRSMLTIIGIFISISTIIILISLSLGLDNAVKKQFEMLGSDKFFIQPKGQAGAPGAGGAVELSLKDVDFIKKISGIEKVTYIVVGNAKIEYNTKARYYMVMGIPTEEKAMELLFQASNLKINEGRFIKDNEKRKVLMGYDYKDRELLGKPLKPKDKIELNGIEFEIVGILNPVGNPQDDQQVYITYDDFKEMFNSKERVDMIWIEIKSGSNIKEIAEMTKIKLMKYRNVDKKTIDFTISTPEELLKSFGNILNIITMFLVGVGAISLLVGSIGIANTMYTSVVERTKDIGTMKAIGAKNKDVMLIFVIESGILGLIGGIIGVVVAIGIGKIIDSIAINYLKTNLLNATIPSWLIIGCLIFSFLIGLISGLFPAMQGSRLKPAETLRYE
jgi:putative ABC transport system permease protein